MEDNETNTETKQPSIALIAVASLFIIGIIGCAPSESTPPTTNNASIQGTEDLILTDQAMQQLDLVANQNNKTRQTLRINGENTTCRTEEQYTKNGNNSHGEYSICAYQIPSLNDTEITIQLQQFRDRQALNGSYQYDSSHYFSQEGLISENTFGDQSTFRVSTENDYGGQFNNQSVHYYHLWITKDLYLIQITSDGSEDAKESIADIADHITSTFQ